MPLHSALATFLGLIISLSIALAPAAVGFGVVALIHSAAGTNRTRRLTLAPAFAAGVLLGMATIASGPIPASLKLGDVFVPGGSWDMTGLQLIAERVPAALDPLHRVVFDPIASLPPFARWAGIAFMGAVTLAAILPFMASQFRVIALRLARNVVVCLLAAVAVVYLACLAAWLVGLLNYWLLAVILFALQQWRYSSL